MSSSPWSSIGAWLLSVVAIGCGERSPEPSPAASSATEAPSAASESPADAPEPEACAQVIVVAWQGATATADAITRSETEARARAEALRQRVDAGEDFAMLARSESDAVSSGPRGGLLGTYARDEWPRAHLPIRDAVFGLEVDQTSDVIHAPYGYVIARRCPVQKVRTRHILVRYRGARNADDTFTRTREEARARAGVLHAQAVEAGADFAALARQHSDDASAPQGGDLGSVGRGRLAPHYEQAAFDLQPGDVSDVIETEFGFHVIQRLPDDEAP
jgi:parvulin-like peptidyl-prolyl isomerase